MYCAPRQAKGEAAAAQKDRVTKLEPHHQSSHQPLRANIRRAFARYLITSSSSPCDRNSYCFLFDDRLLPEERRTPCSGRSRMRSMSSSVSYLFACTAALEPWNGGQDRFIFAICASYRFQTALGSCEDGRYCYYEQLKC